MTVINLNHVNIRAPLPLLDEIRDFYVDVVGLREGDRPGMAVKGYWLYAGDQAVVHLMDSAYRGDDGDRLAVGTSHLDHFALTCAGLGETEERLKKLGVGYRKNERPEFGFTQLFLQDPTGLGVELNFPHS